MTVKRANIELVPLKIILFLWYAGTSCVVPFLALHIRSLGLNIQETALIYTVLPLIQLGAPMISRRLNNQYGSYKCAFLLCVCATALLTYSLLFVPPVMGKPHPPPAIHLICGPDEELDIVVDHCGDEHGSCPHPNPNEALPVRLADCSLDCPFGGSAHLINDAGICFTDDFNNKECHVVEENDTLTESLSLGLYLKPVKEIENICLHPIADVAYQGKMFHNASCLKHLPGRDHTNCSLKCFVEDINEVNVPSAAAFWHAECPAKDGVDRRVTFVMYFTIRVFHHLFLCMCFNFLDASTLNLVTAHEVSYAWQKFWTIFGAFVAPPIAGRMIDIAGNFNAVVNIFVILAFSVAFLSFILELEVTAPKASVAPHKLLDVLHSPKIIALFFVVLSFGFIHGFLETFLFWYLQENLKSSYSTMGLIMSVGTLSGIFFLKDWKDLVKFLRPVNVVCIAGIAHCARCIAYAYIQNPVYFIPLELLEILTFHLFWVAVSIHGTKHAPHGLTVTVKTCIGALHFGLGKALGAGIGGTLMYQFDAWTAFVSFGLAGFTAVAAFFIIYHIVTLRIKLHGHDDVTKKCHVMSNAHAQYVSTIEEKVAPPIQDFYYCQPSTSKQ